jgi:hypothetical protein
MSGILVAYFDLLTDPIVVPTAGLLGVALRRWIGGKPADFREVALLTCVWFVGYGGFWFLKWLIAAAVLGPEVVLDNVLRTVSQRLGGEIGGEVPWENVEPSARVSIARNAALMLPAALVSAAVVFFSLTRLVHRWRLISREERFGAGNSGRLALQLVVSGSMPVWWLVTLQNHSIIHAWFVAPILSWTLISLVCAAHVVMIPLAATRSRPWPPRDRAREA